MKKNWEEKKLAEVCLIKPSKEEARKKLSSSDLVSFVPMENMGIGLKYFVANQVRPLEEVAGNYTYFAEGDVLLAKITPCFENGKLGIARNLSNGVGFGSSEYIVFRTNEYLRNEFLYYFLSREQFRQEGAQRMSGAVGHKRVAKDFIENYPIPILPLPEQQRIVAILDEAFAAIVMAKKNAEKNLQNASAIFESHLQFVFNQRGEGWVEKRLRDLSLIGYGYTESASGQQVGPKFLRITDIQDNRVDWNSVPYCPIKSSDLPKYKLADGDIVFARTGATTGKSYLVTDPPEAVFASYLIRVQLNTTELLPQFINLFFQTQSYWGSIRLGVSGSAQGGFNATKLGELAITFPNLKKEQQSIVTKFDGLAAETQRLESIYQQKLAALDELKKSLLQKAFNGEL